MYICMGDKKEKGQLEMRLPSTRPQTNYLEQHMSFRLSV